MLSSDSDSDRKATRKRGHEKEDTDSDEQRKPKASRRSKQIEQKADNPVIAIDSDEPKIKEEDKPKKKDAEKVKSKNSEPKIKEADTPKQKDGEKLKIKQEGKKPEIKKEKNGSVEDTQPTIKKEKEKVEKEYFIYINGEKRLVRLVTGDGKPEKIDDGDDTDTSVKEEKQPKTLKAFYTVSDSDDNDEKRRKLNQLDGNGDCAVLSAESFSVGSSIEECGDKISLGPHSLPLSYVTYSDMTDSLNRTIADTLSDLFGNHNKSNADSNVESGDSHADKIEINVEDCENNDEEGEKLYCCSECPEKLFTSDGLSCHYRHTHM